MSIVTGNDYIQSLRQRALRVYYKGQLIKDPVDHPVIRPSVNAMAATYDLAHEHPEIGQVYSDIAGTKINRFLHIAMSPDDLVAQNKMQRRLGQLTGTCFQRCVGMDAINALFAMTYNCDQLHKTQYHANLRAFIKERQLANHVIGGAMTDPKGDRSLPPHKQADPDLFVRIVSQSDSGVTIRGAKMHQTGCINSHWLLVMPTMRLQEADAAYAIAGAVPVDHPKVSYIYGRQSCDDRDPRDAGNAKFGGQEAMIIFDDVEIPWNHIFMNGEVDQAAPLVEYFTNYHRRSYVCKSGVGDVLIGAAALASEFNGTTKASHINDKLVEMTHLNETIYGTGIAASQSAKETPSGNFSPDEMLANVCKHNVTRHPFELARLAQDIAGGLVGTLPSDLDFQADATKGILQKYLQTVPGLDVEKRRRVMRLIENMTLGRNAVGYLTESLHGAGSPQAQRIQMKRLGDMEGKKGLAASIMGLTEGES